MMNSTQSNNYDAVMGFLQVFDVLLNLNQVSNDTLLEELQRQNKEYLEKIVKQNETIIEQNKTIIEQNSVLETKLNGIWEQMGESTEEIIVQNKELYQMQEKIWGDISDNTEEILRRLDNGSQQRLP